MADPQTQEPQPPKPKHSKPQTWLFSNIEYDEEDIKLISKELKPKNRLNVMSEEKNDWPYVGPWNRGLHPIFLAFDEMKQYAVQHGTWEESKLKP